MGGVRNGKDAGSLEVVPSRSGDGADVPGLVERHRQSAARLLKEGQAAQAFGELARASRSLPMTPRLASVLVAFSLHAGTEAAAIALLSSSLAHAQGEARRAVRLQLARVLRRVGQFPRAIEALQAHLAEVPGDRRAREVMEGLVRHMAKGEATPIEPIAPEPPPRPAREDTGEYSAPIVQGHALLDEPFHRSETVEFSSPWQEEERTADASPLDARFERRAPEGRHGTVLESPAVWTQEEPTSEASGPPPVPEAPPAPKVEASAPPEKREAPVAPPPLPRGPLVPPPLPRVPRTSEPSVPWVDEDTQPSRVLVPRREDPEDLRVEAQLIARQAWRELARFYLARADGAKDLTVRTESLTRLAELLENELEDLEGAAQVYGQIVSLSGDRAALTEQVRLVSQLGDGAEDAVRRVLDEAVQRASNPRARAAAYLARGERRFSHGELAPARADFEAAVAITPHSIPALTGLARCASESERASAAERLREVLAAVPRRTPFRVEGLRCLAELAGGPLADARLAYWAWTEVLAENPQDEHAPERLLELARQLGDKAGLSRVLRSQLAREPRGPAARKARLELVATLEAAGDANGSLAELRQAVRYEPGHKEAWLLLVERLVALSQFGEAAWAMEHAATATEDDAERLAAWERLARFCREVLRDPARAQVYANRAENVREAIAERAMPSPHPEPPRAALLKPEPTSARGVVLVSPPQGVELTPLPTSVPPAALESSPTVLEMPAASVPVESTRVLSWEAPPGKMETGRRRALRPSSKAATPAPVPEPAPPAAPSVRAAPASAPAPAAVPAPVPAPAPAPAAASAPADRPAAIERVRERPLDAGAYRDLSTFFISRGDTARGSLMGEVASALAGDTAGVARPPRRMLTPEERAGLRHPGLRNPAGELLACSGQALCRLFPTFGKAAGTAEILQPDSGPGARAALEALQTVARMLDVQVPEVCLSEEDGPPFTLVHPGAPRVLVGKLAVSQALPEPELRFFAGRALACLGQDLLSLRCLKKDQLLRGMTILGSVLRGGSEFGPEARVVREALHPASRQRAFLLMEAALKDFDAAALAEAARHSANRTGLVACGGPGPAVAALRALKVSEPELVELVRFAASERYLPLRG